MTHPSLLSLLAGGHEQRLALLARLGFDGPAAPCGPELRERLALDDDIATAHVVVGHGTLRALVVEDRSRLPIRERVRRVARTLDRRMPQWLWLLVIARPPRATPPSTGDEDLAVAAWTAGRPRRPSRVVALVAARDRLVASDADTLRLLAAATPALAGGDVGVHLRWIEILGREAVTRRFFLALRGQVSELAAALPPRIPAAERTELALVAASRLLFLSFLETKGWLDGDRDWLVHAFAHRMLEGGAFHRRTLLPLWFGTLNTPPAHRAPTARALGRIPFLNGGLFTRTPLERRWRDAHLPDEALASFFDTVLTRFRFTAREDSTTWSEAAVDPEMLGKAFESLMGGEERRARGAFYTPQRLVVEVGTQGLATALARHLARHGHATDVATVRALLDGASPPPELVAPLRLALRRFRVLDPACGSGAFLVHALESLATLHRTLGDPRPLADIRREVAGRSIFGVDVQPIAVWLCELRLWLSVVIDLDAPSPLDVPPLPNLDRNVRVGDALLGGSFAGDPATGSGIAHLRLRYARATGARKRTLARTLDREERRVALHAQERLLARLDRDLRDRLAVLRAPDLFGERARPTAADREHVARLRMAMRLARTELRRLRAGGALPFTFTTHFADVAATGGFDAILGNPPWVRPHHVPPATRLALRRLFTVARNAAWRDGARRSASGAGFGGQADLAALFVERSLSLLHPTGALALLVPAKLWRAVAGGGVRRLLAERAELHALEDWSDHPALFDAVTYPSLLVASPAPAGRADDAARSDGSAPLELAVHDRAGTRRWPTTLAQLRFAESDSPWLLVGHDVRRAFERLREAGPPLDDALAHGIGIHRPTLGVKCGCNEAFIATLAGDRARDAHAGTAPGLAIVGGDRVGRVEPPLLRPLARGEAVRAWHVERGDERLLWTHDADGHPLETLPPLAARWLAPWRRRLATRSDARGRTRWWSLFRIEGARDDRPRVVWGDIARRPRAAVLERGDRTVPLNSCYVAPCDEDDDALTLAALLNSPLAAAWLAVLAEPARGGYLRLLAWTVGRLPLPADWPRARRLLAPLARAAAHGRPPSDDLLLAATLDAWALDLDAVRPLLLRDGAAR